MPGTRIAVLTASSACLAAGIVAVFVRLATDGGSYADVFLVLGGLAILLSLCALAAVVQYARRLTPSVHPLAASLLALVILLILALAVVPRGPTKPGR
jgi:hypothetical protein